MTWINIADDLHEIQKLQESTIDGNITRANNFSLVWALKAVLLLKLSNFMPTFIFPIQDGGVRIIFVKKSYHARINFTNDDEIVAEIYKEDNNLMTIGVQPSIEQLRATLHYIKNFLKKPLDKAWE